MALGRWHGTLQILRYNWPLFAATYSGSAAGVVALRRWRLPRVLRWGIQATLLGGLTWSTSALLVAHYVYDLSPLSGWAWLADLFPRPPSRCLNLHAGVDEVGSRAAAALPNSRYLVADFYQPRVTPGGSLRRARQQDVAGEAAAGVRVEATALPFGDGTWDAVLLMFAAHELRTSEARSSLFRELRRVLAAEGVVALVEHLRDLPNALAFGPEVFHFYPRGAWLAAAGSAGLTVVNERRLTPFVRVLVLSGDRSTDDHAGGAGR